MRAASSSSLGIAVRPDRNTTAWKPRYYDASVQRRYKIEALRVFREDVRRHRNGRHDRSYANPCVLGSDGPRRGPRPSRHDTRDTLFAMLRFLGQSYERIGGVLSAYGLLPLPPTRQFWSTPQMALPKGWAQKLARDQPEAAAALAAVAELRLLGQVQTVAALAHDPKEQWPLERPTVRKQVDRLIRMDLRRARGQVAALTDCERDERLEDLRLTQGPAALRVTAMD